MILQNTIQYNTIYYNYNFYNYNYNTIQLFIKPFTCKIKKNNFKGITYYVYTNSKKVSKINKYNVKVDYSNLMLSISIQLSTYFRLKPIFINV